MADILQKLLIPALREEDFAIKSAALSSIDVLNEFVFNNLKRPSKKQPKIGENVQRFYSNYQSIFNEVLRTLAYTLLFEDHKNVWAFQKCVHSAIVMCEGGQESGEMNSYRIIQEIIE